MSILAAAVSRSRVLERVSVDGVLVACILGATLFLVPGQVGAKNYDSVLEAYVEVWNTGEVERLDELIAPGFRRHAGPDESVDSISALADLVTRTRRIYDHLEISVDDSVTTEERGAFRGRFHGVHKAAKGVVEFPLMSIVRFENGSIAEEWIIGDNFLSLMALGYELVPPGFEAIPPQNSSGASGVRPEATPR